MAARTFEAWLAAVGDVLDDLTGLSVWDLPDADYWSAWNDGERPDDFGLAVLRENGFDC